MSIAPEIDMAARMLTVITGATYSQTVTAERPLCPPERMEDFRDKRHVVILPSGIETSHQNRSHFLDIVTVDVALISLPTSETREVFDGLCWLREQIKNSFAVSNQHLAMTSGTASLIDVQTVMPLWLERLKETGGFAAVMQFRWRVSP